MSTYKRKTRDIYMLYVNYGYSWEEELSETSLHEIMERLKEYRENVPQYPVKAVKKRERILEGGL